jgi:hypothetical protein
MEYPEGLQKTCDWAVGATSRKHKAYSVYECPNESFAECSAFLGKRYNKIAEAVPGYTYKMEFLMSRADAIKLMME